uniref:C2H2-type domain-containing protein n=1 Tax=Erpetoichthys calabaricus TaxID=27687 RepID=A0A8C4X2J5_ERPCA
MPLNLNTHSPEQTHSTQDFQCTFCSKSFRVYLTNHLKTHSLMNSFQCQHCSKTFTHQKYLKGHLKTHSTEQTHTKQIFQCTICSKTFQVQRYLNKHLKTHSTERIIQCEHCQQCFETTRAFKKHLQTHSNSFQCQHCTKSFNTSFLFNKHTKTHSNMHSHRIQFSAAFQENYAIPVQEHNIGLPTALCTFCNALHWPAEVNTSGHYTKCCHTGKVSLPPLSKPPLLLQDLLTGKNPLSRNYCDHIREYNSALAFASMGAHIAQPSGHGPYAFRIHGQIYHQVSPLYTNPDTSPRYGQLYIFDSAEATTQRLQKECNSACSDILLLQLDKRIRQVKPFAKY